MPDYKIAPPARRVRLKEAHPTYEKLLKLCDYAEELGLTINFSFHNTIIIDDERDRSLPPIYLKDSDDNSNPMSEFPPNVDYNLVYDNPAYLEYERREHDERKAKDDALRQAKEEEDRLRKEAEKVAHAKMVEERERKTLTELKAKYEL